MDTTSGVSWRRMVPGARVESAPAPSPAAEHAPREPKAAHIPSGMEISGRLVVPKSLGIDGEFSGELESANAVWISETGAVTGPIRARSVEIRGAVVGDIIASR